MNEDTCSQTPILDSFDMSVIGKERALLEDTDYIEKNVEKHLKDVVTRSDGEYSGYHMWDEYDPATRR